MDDQLHERRYLLELLSRFLRHEDDFATFYETFYFHYADDLSDESLSNEDWHFFGAIHEKLDFVAEDPDPQSRKDGWISVGEFRGWLGDLLSRQPPRSSG
jgi:hypothetical protein